MPRRRRSTSGRRVLPPLGVPGLAAAALAPGSPVAADGRTSAPRIDVGGEQGAWMRTEDETPVRQMQAPPLREGNPFDYVPAPDGLLRRDMLALPDVNGLLPN